ncbi:isoleucine--tRNA ligase [Candidatus Woesearchaeota archaeon]|nr:isoleucine--tRNA ligase [Candidatus Woesearchaeota archaeon]
MTEDSIKYEEEMLNFWKENNINEKVEERNKDAKPFYFLQGPPYTSGKIHLGQAWNNTMKDFIIRFKKMNGYDVWNRAGYDMHGLPTERKVQAKFELKTKQDIINFGLDKFSQECYKFSLEKAKDMNQDLINLAVDMDFDNAYMPINKEYIEGIWWLIKEAHNKNRLYEGLRTTSWCSSCATALAKHEQEYKELEDTSIYVKFKVKNKENEFLIIWTTTPWTIPFNLGIMINPEFDYVKAKVTSENKNHNGNIWIVAKELIEKIEFATNTQLEISKEFKGKDIEGLEYEHFWSNEITEHKKIKEDAPKTHTVLMTTEFCTLDAGTGLVHCAPGCGPEDYEVGYQNKIPPFNSIGEDGKFPENMGRFANLEAKKDDKKFIEEMDKDGVLAGKQDYLHDYAHCERCHNPVVFKTTKQWFFKTEDLKDRMLEINKNVKWNPETAKNAFNSWLENLRDNSITKQRFWGTPVPIWKCESCEEIKVIGSVDELIHLNAENIPESNLHKPGIDNVTFKCEKCSNTMKRIPDILDVWIDAGTASWNCLDYPKRKDLFEKYFPADFILEGKDQIRGWFNLLMVAGVLGFDESTFKSVYMHGFISGVDGVKMSKSLGNIIQPSEITSKYGVDTLRCYMSSTTAGDDVSFSWDEADLRFRNLKILWNIKTFLINYSKEIEQEPKEITSIKEVNGLAEKYILSKLNYTIKEVTRMFKNIEIDKLSNFIIDFFLDISRTYIKLVRDKSTTGTVEEKQEVLNTLYTCIFEISKIFNPIAPCISEKIYQDLKEIKPDLKESVYLESWPKHREEFISETLNKEMKNVQDIIQVILAARDKSKIGVRWPLSEAVIQAESEDSQLRVKETLNSFKELILEQTNLKEIKIGKINLKFKVKPNYKTIGKDFGTETGDLLVAIKGKEEEIAQELESGNNYKVTVKDTVHELNKEHFNIEKEAPENWICSELKDTILGLNTIQTENLILEGFAREITRRIQQERKNLGLNKKDRIEININCSEKIKTGIENNKESILAKIGAEEIKINSTLNLEKIEHEIKDEKISIELRKI